MSYTKTGTHSSMPTLHGGSAASSLHMGSYGNPNAASSLGSTTLLRPRQHNARSQQQPLGISSSPQRPKQARCLTGVAFISAIDTASTKLSVPIGAVEPTLAFEDDGLVPGLCRLYLEGRCRQGDRCFQVHADPGIISQLRSEAFANPSCCPAHGAKCKLEGFPLGLAVVIDPPREREAASFNDLKAEREGASTGDTSSNGETSTPATSAEPKDLQHKAVVVLHNICPTRYLWTCYEEKGNMVLHVPKSKICREHRKGLCRFGDECSFLHLCRQIPLAGNDDDFFSRSQNHSRTLSRVPQGSMPDFSSHPPSFSAATGFPLHGPHSTSMPHSMAHTPAHYQPNILVSQGGGSFVGGSYDSHVGSARPPQPLLRPLGGATTTMTTNLATTPCQMHGSMSNASSMHARGSFTHNPYAEASSFQS